MRNFFKHMKFVFHLYVNRMLLNRMNKQIRILLIVTCLISLHRHIYTTRTFSYFLFIRLCIDPSKEIRQIWLSLVSVYSSNLKSMHNKRDIAVRICAQFWSIQHNREVDYLKANIQEKEGKSSAHTQTHTHTGRNKNSITSNERRWHKKQDNSALLQSLAPIYPSWLLHSRNPNLTQPKNP